MNDLLRAGGQALPDVTLPLPRVPPSNTPPSLRFLVGKATERLSVLSWARLRPAERPRFWVQIRVTGDWLCALGTAF